jgi:hypothetical protein
MSTTELIVHKIKAPYLIRATWLYPGFAMNNHLAPSWKLTSKSQSFFAIEPINQIATYRPPLAPQHNLDPAIAISDPRLSDLMHSLPEFKSWITPAGLALGRAMLAC